MRELQYVEAKRLVWRDAAEPRLRLATDVIVRPFVAARCDGDPLFLQRDAGRMLTLAARLHLCDEAFGSPRSNPFLGPFAYGHECVAEVTACGADVQQFGIGDRVIVPWAISCGKCTMCVAGLTSKCTVTRGEGAVAAYGFGAAFGCHGGMVSDAVRVPFADEMLVHVPGNVDPLALASASDNLTDAYRSVAPYLLRSPEAPVLIVGGGAKSIGLYAVGIAKALGSSRIDYLDTSETRLALAAQLGANPIAMKRSASWYRRGVSWLREGYPITVDASSTNAGLSYALSALTPGGNCTGIGFYVRRGTPLPLWKMYMTCATLRVGVAHPRADLPAVLQLVEQRRFDPRVVNTLVADWTDAPHALLERTTKVVLHRPSLFPANEPTRNLS
jgi:alcohol dehydrogenase